MQLSLGSSSETLWEVWGRIINDWDSVKKKPAFLKVCAYWNHHLLYVLFIQNEQQCWQAQQKKRKYKY